MGRELDEAELGSLPRTRKEAEEAKSEYYFTGEPCKNGHTAQRLTSSGLCFECTSQRAKKWRQENPNKVREFNAARKSKVFRTADRKRRRERYKVDPSYRDSVREEGLKHRYGKDIKYEEMYTKQKGCCAICGSKDPGDISIKNLCVDHDHESSKVRGLLCTRCNKLIGFARENPDILKLALAFLTKSRDYRNSKFTTRKLRAVRKV